MEHRNPLSLRRLPMKFDVADAITFLVDRDARGLPLALRREDVAERLVIMHHTDEEGRRIGNKIHMERTSEGFRNYLATSSVFQAGYKDYEHRTGRPVVPVTDFFFEVIYRDAIRDCLEAMLPEDVFESIPKRPRKYAESGTGSIRPINEVAMAEKSLFVSGEVAGIVIYPEGARSQLIAAYHDRVLKTARGAIGRETTKLEHTGFNRPAVADMRDRVDGLNNPTHRIEQSLERGKQRPTRQITHEPQHALELIEPIEPAE